MSKPFDATIKGLMEVGPPDWLALAGFAGGWVELVDADISTVSGATDKVMRVTGPPDWFLLWDAQAGPDQTLPHRLHLYATLIQNRHGLPVRNVALLLRPQANLSNLTGVYEQGFPEEPPYLTFRYTVIRVWELPVDHLLAGGAGTLPLAPISAVTEADLPDVLARVKERYNELVSPAQADMLWTATYVLMGLRYPGPLIDHLMEGVTRMEESVTYQAIIAKGKAQGKAEGLREGAVQEARKALLLQGSQLLGEPGARVRSAVEAIDDLQRLEALLVQVLKAKSWEELLGLSRRPRQRKQGR